MRVRVAALAVLVWLSVVGVRHAHAVTPSDRWTAMPASLGLTHTTVQFESTRDKAPLTGWWFEGKPEKPILVMFDRGRGNMGDLLPVVTGFVERGFTVLTFDYRDFGPAGPGEADSLVQLAFASRWVNDGEGALQYARSRAGLRPVFAWGQDVGGAVAVAAASRQPRNADAVACEGLFRTLPELLRTSGLAQVPGAAERHRFLVETGDEPLSAVANLQVPLHVVLAQKDEVSPPQITAEVVRRSLSRIDRWILPEGTHEGVEDTPGYHDKLAGWFERIAGLIRAARAAAQPPAAPEGK
jgi:pimeloyl-ACP methyl ester carboxylesterase